MSDHIRTFAELQTRYSLHTSQFYCYLQLRHALATHHPRYFITRVQSLRGTGTDGQPGTGQGVGGGVSRIYRSLVNNTPTYLDSLRAPWEGWLGPLEEADWRDALMAPKTLTTSPKLRLIQLYYLHTAYPTPTRLYRFGRRPSPDCADVV